MKYKLLLIAALSLAFSLNAMLKENSLNDMLEENSSDSEKEHKRTRSGTIRELEGKPISNVQIIKPLSNTEYLIKWIYNDKTQQEAIGIFNSKQKRIQPIEFNSTVYKHWLLSEDRNILFSSDGEFKIVAHDIVTGQKKVKINTSFQIHSMCIFEKTNVLCGLRDGTVIAYDLNGDKLFSLSAGSGGDLISHVQAFNNIIVTADSSEIRCWKKKEDKKNNDTELENTLSILGCCNVGKKNKWKKISSITFRNMSVLLGFSNDKLCEMRIGSNGTRLLACFEKNNKWHVKLFALPHLDIIKEYNFKIQVGIGSVTDNKFYIIQDKFSKLKNSENLGKKITILEAEEGTIDRRTYVVSDEVSTLTGLEVYPDKQSIFFYNSEGSLIKIKMNPGASKDQALLSKEITFMNLNSRFK